MAAAAGTSTRPRFLLLSSLAAREPALSAYASSKRLGEDQVRRAAGERIELRASCGRPRSTARAIGRRCRSSASCDRGVLLVPAVAEARFSLIYVEDLADLVIRLLQQSDWCGRVLEPDDGRAGGYRWQDLAEIASRRLGRPCVPLRCPDVLWPIAAVGQAVGATLGRRPLSPW